MAKRFFYVCAGLLGLAFAYQLGVTNVTAKQQDDPIVGIAYNLAGCGGPIAVSRSGEIFAKCMIENGVPGNYPWRRRGAVPGPVSGIAKGGNDTSGIVYIVLESGEVYRGSSSEPFLYVRDGNVRE